MFYTALSDFCAILAKVYTHYCFCDALIAFTVIAAKRGSLLQHESITQELGQK